MGVVIWRFVRGPRVRHPCQRDGQSNWYNCRSACCCRVSSMPRRVVIIIYCQSCVFVHFIAGDTLHPHGTLDPPLRPPLRLPHIAQSYNRYIRSTIGTLRFFCHYFLLLFAGMEISNVHVTSYVHICIFGQPSSLRRERLLDCIR